MLLLSKKNIDNVTESWFNVTVLLEKSISKKKTTGIIKHIFEMLFYLKIIMLVNVWGQWVFIKELKIISCLKLYKQLKSILFET